MVLIITIIVLILTFLGFKTSPIMTSEKNYITPPNEKNIISGTVIKIRDGDTIVVNSTPIRLNGLTCDELGTPLGDQAKSFMQTKILNNTVTCTLDGSKSYDREVGRCTTSHLGDLGALMIDSKLCGRCPRYDKDGTYLTNQKSAGPFVGIMPNYCK